MIEDERLKVNKCFALILYEEYDTLEKNKK